MKKIKKNNLTLMPGRDIRMEPLVGDWPLTMQIRYVAKSLYIFLLSIFKRRMASKLKSQIII